MDAPDPILVKALVLAVVIHRMEELAAKSSGAERVALLTKAKSGREIVKRALGTVQGSAA